MTTQKTDSKQAMRKVFIVDGRLRIHPVNVLLADWKRPSGYFDAMIGNQPIIALRGGWNKVTTYAGFQTRQEAEEFRDVLKDYEARKVRAMRKLIEILQPQQKDIIHLLRTRYSNQVHASAPYCTLEEFSEADRLFRNRFFSALSKLGLTYDDFWNTMIEYEKKEKEKAGKDNTEASWQLSWVMSIVKENVSGRRRAPHR